ncbi:MAG: fumarylacetoacetate hydrolase family protein [Planctomycetes bacterium]|nr:fumarylacetoacetate hydrolase family protein [Planctomycetota bacterium]
MTARTLPPAIFAIGRNYAEHAQEMGGAVDPNPIVFMKNPACVIGDGQAIVIPAICEKPGPQVDWEGELAIEIGTTCRNVKEGDALSMVRAYRAANDVSARWWQKQGSGGQFCRGKSFDTFCPLSEPTRAERIADPQQLRIITRVNGEVMQDASTAGMFHSVARIIATLSDGTTLLAGTLILTGSPSGVGAARKPPIFLKDGDVVEVEIPGVGRIRNPVQRET